VLDNNVGLSASEIATVTSIDNNRPNRFLKMLATYRIFKEVDSKFRYTALLNFLKTDLYCAIAEEQLNVCFKAMSNIDDWIKASLYNSSVKDSPFYRQFKKDFYKYYFEDLELGKRFSNAIRS
jgi:ABC-type microcin C transport system permease subunit YejB